MFIRVKVAKNHRYLQVVENRREGRRTVQRVLATLGRVDDLVGSGSLTALRRSLERFAGPAAQGDVECRVEAGAVRPLGPSLAGEALWRELGLHELIPGQAGEEDARYPVEAVLRLEALRRLFGAEALPRGVAGDGRRDLHRALFWLAENQQPVEDALARRPGFALHRSQTAFFLATEFFTKPARGGRGPGDGLLPTILGVLSTGEGRPVGLDLLPGAWVQHTALARALDQARRRFGLHHVCLVADWVLLASTAPEQMKADGLAYIAGAPLRERPEAQVRALARGGPFRPLGNALRAKEVEVDGRRWVVCQDLRQAARDAADREVLLGALADQARRGEGPLRSDPACEHFLRRRGAALVINEARVKADRHNDGITVVETNTSLPVPEVVGQYRRRLLVEEVIGTADPRLASPARWHPSHTLLRGELVCGFLALALADELLRRLAAQGEQTEWSEVRPGLEGLAEVEVRVGGQRLLLTTPPPGLAERVLRALGVTPPPPARLLPEEADAT